MPLSFLVLFFCIAGFFFLYRLDKIPALWIPGTVIIFLFSRVTDISTFLWASGGEYWAAEANMSYQIAAAFLPHFWAMMLTQVIVTAVFGVGFWLLWVVRIPRFLWLGGIATLSAMSLVSAGLNVLSFLGLW